MSSMSNHLSTHVQDFLMYSRDRRLKDARGPDAEIAPIDMPSLMTPFSRVAAIWRTILAGSCRAPVLARFDEVFAFFINPELIMLLLTDMRYRTQLTNIDKSLRQLLEVF